MAQRHQLKAGVLAASSSKQLAGQPLGPAVIGVGLNVFGTAPYPNATNLLATGEDVNALPRLRSAILSRLDNRLSEMASPEALLRQYHERLLGWGRRQRWQLDGQEIRGVLEGVDLDGRLCVLGEDGMHCTAGRGRLAGNGTGKLTRRQAAPNRASMAPAMCWNSASSGFCAIIS